MIKIACSCGASALNQRRSSLLRNSLYSLSNIQRGLIPGFRFHNQPKNLQAQAQPQVKPDGKELVETNNEDLSPVQFPTRDAIEKFVRKKMPVTSKVVKWIPLNILKTRIRKIKTHEAIEYLYEDLCDEVVEEEFFLEFGMPDTFQSWFTVIELHVYILCCRFMKTHEERWGLFARDLLTEQFWLDVESRAEKLAGLKKRIPFGERKKALLTLNDQFQAAFYGYDEGIQSNDMILAATVWRRFFGFECYDSVLIERLVKYIRVQLHYMTELSEDDILYKDRQLFIPLSEVTVP